MKISIRHERPDDAQAVRETNEQAFGTPLEADIVDALRGAPGSVSLVAALDARIVGHILFTPVDIEPTSPVRAAGLAPMAVRPEYQRQGIGRRLIEEGLEQCRKAGYDVVVVLGHPDYYPRFGFVPAHTRGLRCEFPAPPEAFMTFELEAGVLDGRSGLVRYRPEFSEA